MNGTGGRADGAREVAEGLERDRRRPQRLARAARPRVGDLGSARFSLLTTLLLSIAEICHMNVDKMLANLARSFANIGPFSAASATIFQIAVHFSACF